MPAEFLSEPLSLYSIPAVWVTLFAPMTLKFVTIQKLRGYNNVQPRANTSRVAADKNVPREVAARIERMEGAHLNGNENFPLWVAAILAANYAGLDNHTMNVTSIAYVCARVLYNYIYINNETSAQSWLRSLIFMGCTSLPMYLLFAAANKLRLV
ncbi:hypothetical protein GGX14DRAFT_532176 [Mycena pura]|uniref:Uncharacterized protein n=1 Tax=Mycena pura TaxID=153505 RepID=A0AAD7E1F8_9AGAR|nr:hypothetical protein GGX14DRAFT_532176 [Mycena pura]